MPERPTSWQTFLRAPWGAIAGADFFTTEVWTWRWLVTYYTPANPTGGPHRRYITVDEVVLETLMIAFAVTTRDGFAAGRVSVACSTITAVRRDLAMVVPVGIA